MVSESPSKPSNAPSKEAIKSAAGRRTAARSSLLKWATSVVGLPLTNINQVQNGAVFCYILSAFGELDIAHVQFLAVEEQEYSANYRLLQAAGSSLEVEGLNSRAKLRHWLRLASSEADAWQFLAMLRIRYLGAHRHLPGVKVEPDATPPPAPIPPKKGVKRGPSNFNSTSSVNSTGQCWREVDFSSTSCSSQDSLRSPRLTDTLSETQTVSDRGVKAASSLISAVQHSILDKYAETPSTLRARSCLMQMLSEKRTQSAAEAAEGA